MDICSQCNLKCTTYVETDFGERRIVNGRTFWEKEEFLLSLCCDSDVYQQDYEDWAEDYIFAEIQAYIEVNEAWPPSVLFPDPDDQWTMEPEDYLEYLSDKHVAFLARLLYAKDKAA